MGSERKWELIPDDDFIFSGTENTVLAGFLVFSDGAMCVCSLDADSSGLEESLQSEPPRLLGEDSDLDDIPF